MDFQTVGSDQLLFVLNLVNDAVLLFNNRRLLVANKAFITFTHLKEEALIGRESNYPFLIAKQQDEFETILDGDNDTSKHFNLMCNPENGEGDYFANVLLEFKRLRKGVTCVVISTVQLNAAISEQLRWHQTVDHISGGIWWVVECMDNDNCSVATGDLHTVARSKAARDMITNVGVVPDKFNGSFREGIGENLPTVDANHFISVFSKVSEQNPSCKFQEKIEFPKDTRYFNFSLHFMGRSQQGNRQVLMLAEDITRCAQIEMELDNKTRDIAGMSEILHYFRAFFEYAPLKMGICYLSPNQDDICYVLGNAGLAEMCCTTIEGIKGKTALELGEKPSDIAACIRALKEAIATGRAVQYETKFKEGGQEKTFWACMLPIGNGKCAFFGQDCTVQKQLENHLENTVRQRTEELQQALNIKTNFLATMSHEMRTPLSGVMIALQLLEDMGVSEDQKAIMQTAKICGEQLLSVITDILDLTRLDAQRMSLESNPFDFRAMLEDAIEVSSMDAERKGLELVCDIDTTLPMSFVGDSGRMRQIVVNLLSNAIKFSQVGEIFLKASGKELSSTLWQLRISVKDQGIGIPKSAQEHIFQPFTQADSSMTRRYGGSGLGLCISKRLAELMGGDVTFSSKENCGSEFVLEVTVGTDTTVKRRENYKRYFEKKRIVVIERNDKRRHILIQLLCNLGFEVKGFQDIDEASNCNEPIDLVFIDNREEETKLSAIKCKAARLVQTGYKPVYPDIHFWKVPVRESTLERRLAMLFSMSGSAVDTEEDKMKPSQGEPHPTTNILMAEDNLLNQKVTLRLLNNMGYSDVDIVENGKLAVEAVKKKKYQIVLMDCMMPEMSGLEATELIRKLSPSQQPGCIIALTANAFSENTEKCKSVGMDDVIVKPISIAKLKATLARFTTE